MKATMKSLAYALDRDLKRDLFVFKRTATAIMSMLKTSNFSIETLETMEALLTEKDIFTDEGLTEYQLENFFGEERTVSYAYMTNIEIGLELLNAIRNKKESFGLNIKYKSGS
jgi:hypothetical protein